MSPRWLGLLLLPILGCAEGGDGDTTAQGTDPADEACLHIVEGTTVDGGARPDEAPLLDAGIDPWRVVLVPDATTFVRFETGPGTLVLTADVPDAIVSVTTDGDAVALPASVVNPGCTQDLLTLVEVEVGAGEHVVELADHYQATIWLVGALR